jgi:hypothetical protein
VLDPVRELTSEDKLSTNGELSAKESQPWWQGIMLLVKLVG